MARNGLVEPFWRVGVYWIEGNFDWVHWVELRGIGIAPSVYRTVVRVLPGTSPPIALYYWTIIEGAEIRSELYRTNVRRTNVPERMY